MTFRPRWLTDPGAKALSIFLALRGVKAPLFHGCERIFSTSVRWLEAPAAGAETAELLERICVGVVVGPILVT